MLPQIQAILNTVAGALWGWPMLIFLISTGLWLTIILRGLQFRLLGTSLWSVIGPQKISDGAGIISNRSAMITALAATAGTGNIAGVATAIALGGPGAMFWMWVSGLLGMALKYSETLLGVHYRVQEKDGTFRGGPMYYLKAGTPFPWLGPVFAACLAFAAISIGGMVQSNSMADALSSGFGISPTLVGAVLVITAALIMFGGLTRIARFADVLVPLMVVLYATAGTMVLVLSAEFIPDLLAPIFRDAFTGTAAAGGFVGSTILLTMRYGLARGVFANESGLGSAPIVAATAKTKHPVEQALISMTQTFIDTFFICTFTGLVILITKAWMVQDVASAGASLTNLAFNMGLGNATIWGAPLGSTIVTVSLALFAFTTVLGWGYYGQQGAVYLFGARAAKPYIWLFLACTFFGAQILDLATSTRDGVLFVWLIADIATGLMMLPNLFGLWCQSGKIRALTTDYLSVKKSGGSYKIKPFANTTKPTRKK